MKHNRYQDNGFVQELVSHSENETVLDLLEVIYQASKRLGKTDSVMLDDVIQKCVIAKSLIDEKNGTQDIEEEWL